ncbi:MAG: thermonuclease family protein [Alphaproteobacteria bacterium]|nr:thermonuclease family protein [Alphaproteobacteria bacterium]
MDFDGNKQSARPQDARTFSGPATALDGDTVEVDGRPIDLWGIDAPNLDNSDGWYARAALDDLIGRNGALACTVKDTSGRRDEAVCTNSRAGDVGRAMLQGGWAVVARSDTMDEKSDSALAAAYADAEARARRQRAGLWAGLPGR